MVFADWTVIGSGSATLDTGVKYAGNSSVKLTSPTATKVDTKLEHNTFLQTQCQIVFWMRSSYYFSGINYGISFIPYGYVNLQGYETLNTWEKWRLTFWYDISANTKWSRIERWSGSVWEQQGTDYNWGSGSPTTGKLRLRTYQERTFGTWFDEVEVYS